MPVFSYSRLETFKQCSRKFYYRYIAKVRLEEEPENISAFLGSRVHETLQLIYERACVGTVITDGEAIDHFQRRWATEWSTRVVVPNGSGSAEDCHRLGEQWIRDYYRRHVPFNDATVIGLEMKVPIALDASGKYQMAGYIDRLSRTSAEVWQIHDYKTNNRLPTQAEQDCQPQLAFYEIGIRQMWPDIERVELVWHFLRFDKAIRSQRTPDQLESVRQAAIHLIDDIAARGRDESAFPTHESKLCNYCEYQAICPVRKHLVAVKKLPENQFLAEPGVKLVDRWTELKAKQAALNTEISVIEAEIDQIKEALGALSAREGLQTIVGSEKEVAINEQHKVMFPRKGQEPEKAAELEAKLRASPFWPQVSTLDRSALAALWSEREQQAAQLRGLLDEYGWVEDQLSISLRKRRD